MASVLEVSRGFDLGVWVAWAVFAGFRFEGFGVGIGFIINRVMSRCFCWCFVKS